MLIIRIVKRKLPKSVLFTKLDPSAKSFVLSTVKILMYIFLVIIIISILGIPMTSIVAALTSAFLAVGLALQGALSNFAGGIMLLVFRPFTVGDYITCAGGTGTVKEISFIYTSILTDDNNRITVPNGTLMNDSVINHTVEGKRRVEINFAAAYGTNDDDMTKHLLEMLKGDTRIFTAPAASVKTIGYLDNGVRYSLRMWCSSDDYWDVYFDYMEKTKSVLSELQISAPISKVSVNNTNIK